MRVLFIPQWYPSSDGSIRCGEACREHVRAAALFDDVAVLVYSSRRQRWPTLRWERIDDVGVPTYYATHGLSPIPKTTRPFFYFHLRRAVRRVIDEWGWPDVIHTQDRYGYYVIKAIQNLHIPFVISQHWSGFLEGSLDSGTVRQFAWAFSRAAGVLPANRFAERYYRTYRLHPPTTWLPNALDAEVFRPSRDQAREPWLLHASGFTVEKRFPDIVRAFAQVCSKRPEAVLQVVGDGKNRAPMEALAVRDLPPGSFHFHGYLSKPLLAELMRRASGYVHPSSAETFGCVLMEAMACGCPVLTTRTGGIPAVVREWEGLFADVGNIDQIAEGMTSLLDGTHGLDTTSISLATHQRFNYENVGRLLHEEYLRVARITPENNPIRGLRDMRPLS